MLYPMSAGRCALHSLDHTDTTYAPSARPSPYISGSKQKGRHNPYIYIYLSTYLSVYLSM